MARAATSPATRRGGYQLYSYPDCDALYRGPHEGSNVLVVGRLSERERLFVRKDFAAAQDYARSERLNIENLSTVSVCHQAVVDLLG